MFHYQNYLNSTDFIIQKINEASINDDNDLVAELKEKYKDELSKRKDARNQIKIAESWLKQLPELEDKNQEVK